MEERERRRELSNIRMWSTSLLLLKLASPQLSGRTSTPNGLSIIQVRNNPRLASRDKGTEGEGGRGEGMKEPKKKTDSDSIIMFAAAAAAAVVLVIGTDLKSGAIKVNTFNDSFGLRVRIRSAVTSP